MPLIVVLLQAKILRIVEPSERENNINSRLKRLKMSDRAGRSASQIFGIRVLVASS